MPTGSNGRAHHLAVLNIAGAHKLVDMQDEKLRIL
jgi:hypothetical protein